MVTIGDLLRRVAPDRVFDKALSWGARASSYEGEVQAAIERGQRPVLVELQDDLGLVASGLVMDVDHHGRTGVRKPSALRQVFDLLGLASIEWTRWFDLVAANDVGHVAGLLSAGATQDEVREVRAADRAAQGVTAMEEDVAEQAVAVAERPCDGLAVVRLPHARTAPVFDRLHAALGGAGDRNVVVLSPGEVNVSGDWGVVSALEGAFPGGWIGGEGTVAGYWGRSGGDDGEQVIEFVSRILRAPR
jgi:hypothetical protein